MEAKASVRSSNQIPPKQGVFIYSKLQSFQKASSKVLQLLQDVCENMENKLIDVKPYIDSYKLEDYSRVTIVIVIDSVQTRTVITPVRRDGNVDHWDDLKTLYSKTSPKGSVLIVIYGDENSKDCDGLLAERWGQVWEYNDPLAHQVAKRHTIFSIYQKFNKKQIARIEEYLKTVPLPPIITGTEMDILLLTPKSDRDEMVAYLNGSPFLVGPKQGTCKTCQGLESYSYSHVKESYSDNPGKPCLKIFYRDRPKVDFSSAQTMEGELTKLTTGKIPDTNDKGWCKCERYPSTIDRLVFSCITIECFKFANDTANRRTVERMLKSKLARLGLRLRGDSMSIISSEIPENNDAIIDAILFLRCQAREEFATKEAIQRSLPDVKSLVLSQFHYVTQSPTLYDPSIQLSEEEKSNMEGEKKELQQSIKELKAELKVKEEQMSEIEVKLSTGWSKRAVKLKNFFSGWGS